MTWNLQGSKGVDVSRVAAVVRRCRPDLFVIQEVQRRQARRLAAACSLPVRRWAFKHWPVRARPEGLAVLGRHPFTAAGSFVLQDAVWWSWRRRIALDVTARLPAGDVRLIDVHLSPHDAAEYRAEEIGRVMRHPGDGRPIVTGDFNDEPGGPAMAALRAGGWTDAWTHLHGEALGATNWTAGDRTDRAPTQRLDVVFVPQGWEVVSCAVIDEPLAQLAELSDHLPLHVVVRR